ncbi:MAG: IS1595 family transposase [Methylocella sp.]
MAEYTFQEFQIEYPNDTACLAKVMEILHGGDETHCDVCDRRTRFHPMHARRAYACQECGHHIYPCAGTIFHKSSTKLTIWFFAMYLMTSTRHGVAAKEIERQTGVTYKCAWRICHELRKLMASADHRGPLGGDGKHVEVDETLLGGRIKGQGRGRHTDKKITIFGMVERGGKIRTGTVQDQTASTIEPIILEHVAEGTIISTDMHGAYTNLSDAYEHGAVDHKADEWVRGIHHTNTIEGHWSQFKRAVKGTHVHISKKHAWKYVCEFNYRRNYRASHWSMFNLLIEAFALPRLREQ